MRDVPPALHAPFLYRDGLRARETPGRLRGPGYERLARGLVVVPEGPEGWAPSHAERARAMLLLLPHGTVLGGASAAAAHGVPWIDPGEPVEVILPAGCQVRVREELRVRRDDLPAAEVRSTAMGPATSAARTAFDLARRLPPDPSVRQLGGVVAAVDAVLRAGSVDARDAMAVRQAHPRVRGVRRAELALALADARAESPPESVLRVMLVRAGFPAPTLQHEIRDACGVLVARLDLAWPRCRVAVEVAHGADRAHSYGAARHNALCALGWVVLQVDGAQLHSPFPLVGQLRGLLAGC